MPDVFEERLPNITLFASFSRKQRFELECETYSHNTLFVVAEGAFVFSMDKRKEKTAVAGDVIMCPAQCPFSRRAIETMSFYMIGFDGDVPFPQGHITVSDNIKKRLLDSCACAGSDIVVKNPHPFGYTAHFCRDVVAALVKSKDSYNVLNHTENLPGDIKRAIDYIDSAGFSSQISNGELARVMGLSRVSVINRFSGVLGITPHKYMEARRIEFAKRLLLGSDKPVLTVAAMCGYDDPLYFSRVFKKATGTSPLDFRRMGRV